eukprot:m.415521 g.415521  ORF g.415521 m.415521 type:complete len:94 (+) comp56597_c0_seq41:1545-1826(+)
MNEGRLKYALQQIHWAHLQIPLANIHANQPDLERSGSFTSVTTCKRATPSPESNIRKLRDEMLTWLSLTERLTCEFSLTRPCRREENNKRNCW